MSRTVYERIRRNPKFQELSGRRRRLAITLSTIVLVTYYGFMMIVAFAPSLLARPLASGSITSVGVPIGAGLIVLYWALTGIYVRRANAEFDVLNDEIVRASMVEAER
jgi:uncharacterized membrane protein (DUF485 family)